MGGGQISQGVGWEIAKATKGPVDVLEAATGVVGDFEAEEFFEEFVPSGGEVANGEITFKELGFQFKAEKDVEIVSDLVGLDADEGALDSIRGTPAVFVVVTG